MPALVAGIHAFLAGYQLKGVMARSSLVKPGHDAK